MYEIERPEVEGDDLTPAESAAVRLKTQNLLLEAENKALRAGAPLAAEAVPTASAPADEPDRDDVGWWNADPHLMDRRYSDSHPRNVEGSLQWKRASEEVLAWTMKQQQAHDAYMNETVAMLGNTPVDRSQMEFYEEQAASRQALIDLALAEPLLDGNGNEIHDRTANPGEGPNDPKSAEYQQEAERRKQARLIALHDTTPNGPGKAEGIRVAMYELGYQEYAPTRQEMVEIEIRELNRQNGLGETREQFVPADQMQSQVDEALAQRDYATAIRLVAQMDGRA